MNDGNGVKLKFAEDIATLKADVNSLRMSLTEHHKEIMEEFRLLREKVNEEITMMQKDISTSKKLYWKILIGVLLLGSFIWIKESRDFILKNIFNVLA